MPRSDHWQGSFAAGELSPLLAGQPDTPAYAEGVAASLNGVLGPQGQWQRRPGTLFRYRLDDDAARVRLLAFEPTTGTAFMLLLTHQNCAIFAVTRDDAAAAPIATLTTPWSGFEVEAIDVAQSGNTLFLTHPDHPPHMLGYGGMAALSSRL